MPQDEHSSLELRHTDASAIRLHYGNDILCDYARPNEDAGLHKHTICCTETHGLIHCMACGRIWEPECRHPR